MTQLFLHLKAKKKEKKDGKKYKKKEKKKKKAYEKQETPRKITINF